MSRVILYSKTEMEIIFFVSVSYVSLVIIVQLFGCLLLIQ